MILSKAKKLTASVLVIVFLVISVSKAEANFDDQQFLRILFKGNLTDNEAKPLPAGKYNFKFLIYDQEVNGNLVWQEIFADDQKIEVNPDGFFKAVLGRNQKIELDFNKQDYYLTLAVGGKSNIPDWDQEMMPRRKIITLEKFIKEQQIKEENDLITQLLKNNFLNNATNVILVFDTDTLKKITKELQREELQNSDLKIATSELDFLNSGLITASSTDYQDSGDGFWSKLKNIFSVFLAKLSAIIAGIRNLLIEIARLNEKIDRLSERLTINQIATTTFFNTEATNNNTPTETGTLNSSQNEQTTGHIETLLDANALFIREQFIKENSLIFITFLKNPLSNWWISRKIEGEGFEISFTNDGVKDLNFDYWIINNRSANVDQLPPASTDETTSEITSTPPLSPDILNNQNTANIIDATNTSASATSIDTNSAILPPE